MVDGSGQWTDRTLRPVQVCKRELRLSDSPPAHVGTKQASCSFPVTMATPLTTRGPSPALYRHMHSKLPHPTMPHWAKPSPAAGVQIFPLAILTYDRAKRQKLLAGPDWDAFRRALSGCCVCVFLKVHLVSKAGAANAVLVLMQELLAVHYSADRAAHRAAQHVLA